MGMEELWIIGLGQFGSMALHRLSKFGPKKHFVLVDPVAENLLKFKGPTTTLEISDGVKYLHTHLSNRRKPDWIIPALPVHLAAEWLLLHLGPQRLRRVPLPAGLAQVLPNPFLGSEGNLYVSHADFRCPNSIRGSEGNIYTSHADFRCPEDCDESGDICTITRKARNQDMFELLGNLDVKPFMTVNIRSYQLGPGIGGYRPEHLMAMRNRVRQARGAILLSTACRCHGVITGLERT